MSQEDVVLRLLRSLKYNLLFFYVSGTICLLVLGVMGDSLLGLAGLSLLVLMFSIRCSAIIWRIYTLIEERSLFAKICMAVYGVWIPGYFDVKDRVHRHLGLR